MAATTRKCKPQALSPAAAMLKSLVTCLTLLAIIPSGQSLQVAAPLISCSKGDRVVQCLVDPCQVSTSTCKGKPGYTCYSNYCNNPPLFKGNTTIKGTGPCSAIYIQQATETIVTSCPPVKQSPISCRKGDKGVQCKADPCQVSTSSCKGKPGYKCYPNYCSKAPLFNKKTTIKGVLPCAAIYVRQATGTIVKSCPKVPGLVCRCASIYRPVCGKDGKTYANPCLATCSYVAIKYYGSCEVCKKCGAKGPRVCGSNGKTYLNKCGATCAGVTVKYLGSCKPACRKLGSACDTMKSSMKCCAGAVCWTGPVAREGVTRGRCLSSKGPLPIG